MIILHMLSKIYLLNKLDQNSQICTRNLKLHSGFLHVFGFGKSFINITVQTKTRSTNTNSSTIQQLDFFVCSSRRLDSTLSWVQLESASLVVSCNFWNKFEKLCSLNYHRTYSEFQFLSDLVGKKKNYLLKFEITYHNEDGGIVPIKSALLYASQVGKIVN